MKLISLIGGLLAVVGAIFYLVVSIQYFGGIDDADQAKMVSGMQGLAYTLFFAGVGVFLVDRAME